MLAVFTIAALVCATSDLQAGGIWQKIMIQRRSDLNLPIEQRSMNLDEQIAKVRSVLSDNPIDAMGHRVMATLLLDRQHQIGSKTLVRIQATNQDAANSWAMPINVRRAVHTNDVLPETVMLENQNIEQWRLARQHAASSLVLSPLDDATRVLLIETDFLDPDRSKATKKLLIQAAKLRPKTPKIIDHLSLLAKSYPGEQTENEIRQIAKTYEQENLNSANPSP